MATVAESDHLIVVFPIVLAGTTLVAASFCLLVRVVNIEPSCANYPTLAADLAGMVVASTNELSDPNPIPPSLGACGNETGQSEGRSFSFRQEEEILRVGSVADGGGRDLAVLLNDRINAFGLLGYAS